MKYEKPVIELERYEALDIIASSADPIDPTHPTSNDLKDPYLADKF